MWPNDCSQPCNICLIPFCAFIPIGFNPIDCNPICFSFIDFGPVGFCFLFLHPKNLPHWYQLQRRYIKSFWKEKTGVIFSADEVWNLNYILVHGDDKIIFGNMTTYNPPPFGLKQIVWFIAFQPCVIIYWSK